MINKDKSSYYMHSKVANGLFQAVGAITGFARGLQEVAELRQGETWDDQLLDQTFNEEIAEHIRLNVHYEGSEGYWDRPYWMSTPSGKFSVSSAWQILRHRAVPNKEFKLIWIKGLPFKISFFLWRLWRQKIATDDRWRRQGQMVMSRCWCCQQPQEESIEHIFVTSPTASKLPCHGWYKCNTDGASKGNPGPSSLGFCVRDDEGDVVYARAVDLGVTTNVVAEAKAILQGLEYCVEHDFHPLILETDSLNDVYIKGSSREGSELTRSQKGTISKVGLCLAKPA
ncbi:uncharacterized protein LOC142172413 [Nicotiana tabacum]|uniref:Uncharacterized protein LOC142172413 n=1 Tax=Nicotiana tabacum TaxID=4097 RepID=A0AC58T4I0_TOBAC